MRVLSFIFRKFSEHRLFGCVGLSLVILYGTVNFFWLTQNLYPYGPDEFNHLAMSFSYYRFLVTQPQTFLSTLFFGSGHWPPLYHVVASFFYALFGFSYVLAGMSNILYFIVLLCSVYFIGQKMFDQKAAVLAVLCAAFYPAVFVSSRVFNPDFALMAFVCLAMAMLTASNDFRDRRVTLGLGVVCGLGMLAKWTFVLFVSGPVLMVLFDLVACKEIDWVQRRRQYRNVAAVLFIGAAIASLWYVLNGLVLFKRVNMFLWDTGHLIAKTDSLLRPGPVFQLNKFFEYIPLLINEGVTLPFFLLLAGTAVFYFRGCGQRLLLLLWFLVPYVVLSFSYQKEARFLLPALPALALMTAGGVRQIRFLWLRILLCVAVVAFGVGQYLYVSFYAADEKQTPALTTPVGDIYFSYDARRIQDGGRRGPPWKEDWRLDRVADVIRAEKVPNDFLFSGYSRSIGVICADAQARGAVGYPYALDYYLFRRGVLDTRAVHLMEDRDRMDFLSLWPDFDAFIVISKDIPWVSSEDLAINYEGYFDRHRELSRLGLKLGFLLGKLPLPDTNPVVERSVIKSLTNFLKHKPDDLRLIGKVGLSRGLSAYIYLNENKRNGADVFFKNRTAGVSFFQGRAYVFYEGAKLTAKGIETVFKVGGKEYGSGQAHWVLEKRTDKELFLVGRWGGLPDISQVWHFDMSKGKEISFDVNLRSKSRETLSGVEFVHMTTWLGPKYTSWESEQAKGRFDRAGPVRVLNTVGTRFLGVSEPGCPSFCFLFDGPESPLVHIDSNPKERMLRYWAKPAVMTLPEGGYELSLKGRVGGFLEKEKSLLRSEKQSQQVSLTQNGLQLFFDAGQGRIFIDGKEVTLPLGQYRSFFGGDGALISKGIETVFKVGGKEYGSGQAHWVLEKRTDKELFLVGRWDGLPDISQVWHFDMSKGKEIGFDVNLRSKSRETLSGVEFVRMTAWLDPKYTSWESGQERGLFRDMDDGGVILRDATAGSLSVAAPGKPSLFFFLDEPASSLAQIHYYKKGRMLKYWAKPTVMTSPEGGYELSLKARIEALPKAERILSQIQKQAEVHHRRVVVRKNDSLSQKNLEVFLDAGQGRIFVDGKEITKGFGFYTTVFVGGIAQDSQNALWDVRKINDTTLVATGQWVGMPLRQTWTLVLKDAHMIEWNVDLELISEFELQGFSAGLILNEDFKIKDRALMSVATKKFSSDRRQVVFQACNSDPLWKGKVGTADFLPFKNTFLEYKRMEKMKVPAGRKEGYFKAQIRIE